MKPYFRKIKVQGMMMNITLEWSPKIPVENYLKSCKELVGHLMVFVECPRCHMEVPKIDMTKYGYCFFCLQKDEAPMMKAVDRPIATTGADGWERTDRELMIY
jgi:hypothetical protein